jgi:FdrA protein
MRLSRRLSGQPGVENAALMIGTPSNKALLRDAGLLAPDGEGAGPNDLIIAVRAGDEKSGRRALDVALTLDDAPPASQMVRTKTLAGAVDALPRANLALISVPGEFAANEARKALAAGLHVLVFSSGVPIEEERALKLLAREKGLLLMGPDCGTAIIAGTPLAFANVVPRGDIGIISASGTGAQEVSCLIARLGGGVSHVIGVGGRDLDERVGALATLAAIDALEADPATRTMVLISKPPAPNVAEQVRARLKRASKKHVVCFLGQDDATLQAAAEMATGRNIEPLTSAPRRSTGRMEGLYCGGTLCSEAELVFRRRGLSGHRFVDLGDERYTRGRPHPMIEPELRNEHVAAALKDPAVGAILVDVVLGYGAHADPAGVLLQQKFTKPVVASVVGTDRDPQVRGRQVAALEQAGVIVAASNAQAAELAASIVS